MSRCMQMTTSMFTIWSPALAAPIAAGAIASDAAGLQCAMRGGLPLARQVCLSLNK